MTTEEIARKQYEESTTRAGQRLAKQMRTGVVPIMVQYLKEGDVEIIYIATERIKATDTREALIERLSEKGICYETDVRHFICLTDEDVEIIRKPI